MVFGVRYYCSIKALRTRDYTFILSAGRSFDYSCFVDLFLYRLVRLPPLVSLSFAHPRASRASSTRPLMKGTSPMYGCKKSCVALYPNHDTLSVKHYTSNFPPSSPSSPCALGHPPSQPFTPKLILRRASLRSRRREEP